MKKGNVTFDKEKKMNSMKNLMQIKIIKKLAFTATKQGNIGMLRITSVI